MFIARSVKDDVKVHGTDQTEFDATIDLGK